MTDQLRDLIAAAIDRKYNDEAIGHTYEVCLHAADAVIEALPELNPDHVMAKYLKDWEEGYDEGYSAGGGGC